MWNYENSWKRFHLIEIERKDDGHWFLQIKFHLLVLPISVLSKKTISQCNIKTKLISHCFHYLMSTFKPIIICYKPLFSSTNAVSQCQDNIKMVSLTLHTNNNTRYRITLCKCLHASHLSPTHWNPMAQVPIVWETLHVSQVYIVWNTCGTWDNCLIVVMDNGM